MGDALSKLAERANAVIKCFIICNDLVDNDVFCAAKIVLLFEKNKYSMNILEVFEPSVVKITIFAP